MKTNNFFRTTLLVVAALTTLCLHAAINGGTITLTVGQTYTVNADFGGGLTQTGSWTKSNSTFTFVSRGNKSCTISGNQVGTGTLYYDGVAGSYDVNYYWTINVVAPEPTSISVSPSSQTISIGETFTPTYTISPSNATTTVTWSSSNNNVASVNRTTGKVTGVSAGTASVTATTSNGKTSRCEVTVEKEEEDANEGIEINETNFPDEFFREYLLAQDYGKDKVLTTKEIQQIKYLNVSYGSSSGQSYGKIADLKGIEFFTELTELSCAYNQLPSLDISNNTALTYLYCAGNQLTSLDVSKNMALTDLTCHSNQLTSLDVSKNTKLTDLGCHKNKLTSLDVSKNIVLKYFQCDENQLTSLDVSKNTVLNYLYCSDNLLTSLDVSKNKALWYFDCSSNKLTSLDVSQNTSLNWLSIYRNNIKEDAMNVIINGLPKYYGGDHILNFYWNIKEDEGNVCTKSQVDAIKTKKWTPRYYNGTEWLEYEGVDVSPVDISLPVKETISANATLQLTPTVKPIYAVPELLWSSDDTSIAKVTATGTVIGIKEGTAIISVSTSNGLVAECFVVVKDVPIGISQIEVDTNSDVPIYNLSGQRVESLQGKKGVHIIGGKKVMVK